MRPRKDPNQRRSSKVPGSSRKPVPRFLRDLRESGAPAFAGMTSRMRWPRGLLAVLALGLASCASVPTQLRGEFPESTPKDAVNAQPTGAEVRWGGEIITTEPQVDETCFEILGRKLDINARPRLRNESQGRFIACGDGFFDPEVYARGREVTVIGRYTDTETGKVGEFDYVYPHIDADTIYLWPERTYYSRVYGGPYYDPFWYGGFSWGYGFGPYWGPGFGGPPVIIVPGGGHHSHPRPPPRPRPPPPPHRDN